VAECLGKLKYGCHSGGIIVGPRMNLPAITFSPKTYVVEVGSHNDYLPSQLRVIPRQDGQDVGKSVSERLEVLPVHPGRGYLHLFKLLGDPSSRLLSRRSPRLPALKLWMSKETDNFG
jgi:hypothetical protein